MLKPHTSSSAMPVLEQGLLGAVALALVAIMSLPAARGVGAIGWWPLWLTLLPFSAWAALRLSRRLSAADESDRRRLPGSPRRAVSARNPRLRRSTAPARAWSRAA